jgi:hypothetical protein
MTINNKVKKEKLEFFFVLVFNGFSLGTPCVAICGLGAS